MSFTSILLNFIKNIMRKLYFILLLIIFTFASCQKRTGTLNFIELKREIKVAWYSIDDGCVSYKEKKSDSKVITICNSAVEIISDYAVGDD